MRVDTYTKSILTVIAVALSVMALNPWLASQRWLQAMATGTAEAQDCPAVTKYRVPASWGNPVAAWPSNNINEPSLVFGERDAIILWNTGGMRRNLEAGHEKCTQVIIKKVK